MSAGPQDYLFEALGKTFQDDSTRRAVLVLGAGLHYNLKQLSASNDPEHTSKWEVLTNWNGLLASVVKAFGLPEVRHEDPAATWESAVARIAYRGGSKESGPTSGSDTTIPASTAEQKAATELAKRLADVPLSKDAAIRLGRGLARYRDTISLNIDEACVDALIKSGTTVKPTSRQLGNRGPAFTWQHGSAQGRLWYPHGVRRDPTSIVLGTASYGRTLTLLQKSWDCSKAAESRWDGYPGKGKWTPEKAEQWWTERRGVTPCEPEASDGTRFRLTWLDLFIGSDLVFIGTSLDRAETDLWWTLHMRQRNLARIRPSERPRAFVVCQEGSVPRHLLSGPAGITPVVFSRWDEAWNMLLGE